MSTSGSGTQFESVTSPEAPPTEPDVPPEMPFADTPESVPQMPVYRTCSACGVQGFHMLWCPRPVDPQYREPYQPVPCPSYCQVCGMDGHRAPICPVVGPGPRRTDAEPHRAPLPEEYRPGPSRRDAELIQQPVIQQPVAQLPVAQPPLVQPPRLSRSCRRCGDEGHRASTCARRSTSRRSRSAPVRCQICGGQGHRAADCFQEPSSGSVSSCQLCGATDHQASECFRGPHPAPVPVCQICGHGGHVAQLCPMAEPQQVGPPSREAHPPHPPGAPASGYRREPRCRLCMAFRSCWGC